MPSTNGILIHSHKTPLNLLQLHIPTKSNKMTTLYEPHQLNQISCLLNDTRECITLRSIMLELTVNRNIARSILDALVTQSLAAATTNDNDMDVDKKYQVVRMISKFDNGKQRMELVNGGNEGSIFSIALSTSENNDFEKVHRQNEEDGDESMDEDDVDENGNPIEKKSSNNSSANTTTNTVSGVLQQLTASHEKSLSIQESCFVFVVVNIKSR